MSWEYKASDRDRPSFGRLISALNDIEQQYRQSQKKYKHLPVMTENKHICDEETERRIAQFKDALGQHSGRFNWISKRKREILQEIREIDGISHCISSYKGSGLDADFVKKFASFDKEEIDCSGLGDVLYLKDAVHEYQGKFK